jgi:restriction endonuclease
MPLTGEPQLQDYGLSDEIVRSFCAFFSPSELLAPLLGWASFIGLTFLLGLDFLSKREYLWPVVMLYFVPGMLVGFGINKLRKTCFEYSKKKHPLYQNWKRYSVSHSEWCQQNSQAIADERTQQASLRKQEVEERRRQLAWWMTLDGQQFEKETASLLRQLGYEVTLTPYWADGGVDIVLRDGAKRIIVQCKAHRNYVSAGVVRELYGTMLHEKADEGWVVITTGFYSGARSFAHGKPIKLITIKELLNRKWQPNKSLQVSAG